MSDLPTSPSRPSFIASRSEGMRSLIEHRPLRFVALDFETAAPYDHIVEIGAVEIVDGVLTGRSYHRLLRPRIPIDGFTTAVHGITDRKVARKPAFADAATEFLGFLGDSLIIAHAAHVERIILEKELGRLNYPALDRCQIASKPDPHFASNSDPFGGR